MSPQLKNLPQAKHSPQNVKIVQTAIVGAGFGGMAMAIRLLQKGENDFVILEKGDDVGGTWHENTYPGAACDVQSHMYSFSFVPKTDWSKRYAEQPEIEQYLKDTAEKFNLKDFTRFNTEVVGAEFDELTGYWTLQLKDGSQILAHYFVLASGPLHVPQIPKLKGIERFKGKVFHSAQWDHDYDLKGKKVVSIGTGGSAIQYVPEIAPEVEQLYVFQRTPAWVIPRDTRSYLPIEKKLFAKSDLARKLHRARLYWSNESRVMPIFNPTIMKFGQKLAEQFIRFQVKDPATVKKLTPDYVMGCKRILISNKYYPTFNRDNVDLITDGIAEVKENSIVTKSGRELPVDCIIYGTGFITDPRIYMKNFPLKGAEGHVLQEDWKDNIESYYGITVAGYPNMFQLVGPNTGLGHNSIVFMIEAQVNYILHLIDTMLDRRADIVDVTPEAQKSFVEKVSKNLEGTVWQSGCTSWYQTSEGTNFAIWPGYTWRYWLETLRVKPKDYIFKKAPKKPIKPAA